MKWFYVVLGMLAVAALFALTLQSAGLNTVPPPQALRYDHVLACAECAAAGQQANIWRTAARDQLQCRAVWGAKVAIISRHDDMLQVDVQDWCRGYVGASLVQ